MVVYRIASPIYIDDLSGTGAKQYGGRWNDVGVAMVYFAESRAMAVMEVLTHLRPEELDREYTLAEFDVPEDKILSFKIKDLPNDWNKVNSANLLKKIGADFASKNKYLLLKVPSVILVEEYNFLLNPNHPDAKKIKLMGSRVFEFDKRLKN